MIGNVWEWTTDWWSAKHTADAPEACCIPVNPRGGPEAASYDPQLPDIRIPRKVIMPLCFCPSVYVLREMGYQIARKHAVKLRWIALTLAFLLPALLALLTALGIAPAVAATGAALSALIGLFVERWLFFAEATHVSTIYYGR